MHPMHAHASPKNTLNPRGIRPETEDLSDYSRFRPGTVWDTVLVSSSKNQFYNHKNRLRFPGLHDTI